MTDITVPRDVYRPRHAIWARAGLTAIVIMPMVALFNIFTILKWDNYSIHPLDVLFVFGWTCFVFNALSSRHVSKNFVILMGLIGLASSIAALDTIFSPSYEIDPSRFFKFLQTMLWGVLGLTFIRNVSHIWLFAKSLVLSTGILAVSSVFIFLTMGNLDRIAGFVSYAGGEGFNGQASYNEVGTLFALAIGL